MNRAFIAILGSALLLSCATTRVTDSWRNPNAQQPPIRKLLVAAQVPSESVRQRLEQELTRRLLAEGLQAVPSYELLPVGAEVTQETLQNVAEREQFEGTMVARFAGIDEEVHPRSGYYGWGVPWAYYPGSYYRWGYDFDEEAVMETTISESSSGEVVWSATTESDWPEGLSNRIPDLATKIVERLEEDRVLRPSTG